MHYTEAYRHNNAVVVTVPSLICFLWSMQNMGLELFYVKPNCNISNSTRMRHLPLYSSQLSCGQEDNNCGSGLLCGTVCECERVCVTALECLATTSHHSQSPTLCILPYRLRCFLAPKTMYDLLLQITTPLLGYYSRVNVSNGLVFLFLPIWFNWGASHGKTKVLPAQVGLHGGHLASSLASLSVWSWPIICNCRIRCASPQVDQPAFIRDRFNRHE